MALTSTERSLCNKISTDYDSLVAPVKSSKKSITDAKQDLDTYLRGMTYSPDVDIDSALLQLANGVADAVPGDDRDAMNDIKNVLDRCSYLNGLAPVSAVIGTFNGVFDAIDDLIESLQSTVPEFGAGALASLINQLLNGVGIPGGDMLSALLAKADTLINCLSEVCVAGDPGYSGRLTLITNDLDNLYTDLNVVGNPLSPNYGKFDYDTLYGSIGMSAEQQAKVKRTTAGIDTSKANAKTAIGNSISAIKTLTKIGGFF